MCQSSHGSAFKPFSILLRIETNCGVTDICLVLCLSALDKMCNPASSKEALLQGKGLQSQQEIATLTRNPYVTESRGKEDTLSNRLSFLYVLEEFKWSNDPRVTSGLRQLVTRAAKLFVNLLLVITSSFLFTTKTLKIIFLSRLLHYVQRLLR
jgi:hypothetical protein